MSKKTYLPASKVGIALEGLLYDSSSKPCPVKDRRLAINMLQAHGQLQSVGVCAVDSSDKLDCKKAKASVIFGRRRTRAARMIEIWQDDPKKKPYEIDQEQLDAFPGLWVDMRPRPINAIAVILAENVERHNRTTEELIEMTDRVIEQLKAGGTSEKALLDTAAKMMNINVQTVRQHLQAAKIAGDVSDIKLALSEGKMAAKTAASLQKAMEKAREKREIAVRSGDDAAIKLADEKLIEERAKVKAKAREALAKEKGSRAAKGMGPAAKRKFLAELEAEAPKGDIYIKGALDCARLYDGAEPSLKLQPFAEAALAAIAKKGKKKGKKAETPDPTAAPVAAK